jgi:hypothetical protein
MSHPQVYLSLSNGEYESLAEQEEYASPYSQALKIFTPRLGEVSIAPGAQFVYRPRAENGLEINIVYFINTYCSTNYAPLFIAQMEDLKQSGLLERAKLFIVACTSEWTFLHHVQALVPQAEVDIHTENNHEYFGISKVWQLAQNDPNKIILYFHSKGISRIAQPSENFPRTYLERRIFALVIRDWARILHIFDVFPSVDKVGVFGSPQGWIWYNFFWVRSSYAAGLEEPVETERRWYYEEWLARYLPKNRKEKGEKVCNQENYQLSCHNSFNLLTLPHLGFFSLGTGLTEEQASTYY